MAAAGTSIHSPGIKGCVASENGPILLRTRRSVGRPRARLAGMTTATAISGVRIHGTPAFAAMPVALRSITHNLGVNKDYGSFAVPLGATSLEFHDGVDQAVVPLLPGFPYLNTPIPGAK